ncbi:MAG: SDR family oxidoreductase [Myxococcales bacterium]|nr:SDR family oxidoreductase [Myxococcales bacterium]
MFKDKIILILGATAGLAEATLPWLLEQGASLLLQARTEARLASLQESLKAPSNRLQTLAGEITDPSLFEKLWKTQESLDGQPFGYLCFTGIPARMTPDTWNAAEFASIFAINCASPLILCHQWAQQMKARSLSGNAVLFTTMQSQAPFANSLPYALSKGALPLGVEILAKELGAPPAIRVNAIAPGVNEAGMALASIQKGKYQPFLDKQIIPRYGNPTDIQQALQLLLQPDLYMTGQTLLLDGGLILRRDG